MEVGVQAVCSEVIEFRPSRNRNISHHIMSNQNVLLMDSNQQNDEIKDNEINLLVQKVKIQLFSLYLTLQLPPGLTDNLS